eukprot:Nitzschia sp. Nitz4//scaffold56_size114212//55353//57533//NITZ4_003949-RA/size114212-processed-gene-0.26-mRNA-1//-1//CDS//3329554703//1476//frame0
MGIHGARSLMDADPARYCEAFLWNWADESVKQNLTLGLLIDAKSVLYHVVLKQESVVYASPATIYECCLAYFRRLLQVVGEDGGVHIFLDGLPPHQKIHAQVDRMAQQAITADQLARGEISGSIKLLHHLAEWAFVEAITNLQQTSEQRIVLHRPQVGEAEAHINQWLLHNPVEYSKIAIISEDSDFLVYNACPGFIPPSSLRFTERQGKFCLQGQHYVREKFLRAFLGEITMDTSVMTTVAAIAGCDYALGKEQAQILSDLRAKIAASDLGGLRPKLRTNPTAAAALKAILRLVAHFKVNAGNCWLKSLCQVFASPKIDEVIQVIQSTHQVYYYALQLPMTPELEIPPGMVEVRRLLQYGMVYCYPVIETFRSFEGPDDSATKPSGRDPAFVCHFSPGSVQAHALVPVPPLSTQIEVWSARSSIWHFPHFRQIRARLYSYIRLQVYNGRVPTKVIPGDFWITSSDPVVEEVIRMNAGQRTTVQRTRVVVPEHATMSAMFDAQSLLEADEQSLDKALVFCIHGTPQQLVTVRPRGTAVGGVVFVASTMLPFNLAFLLIMLSTVPKEVYAFDIPALSYDTAACSELNQVLPMMTVACAHADLLVNTLACFWTECEQVTNLGWPALNVSATFQHDVALMIWSAVRDGRNLEYLKSQDSFVSEDGTNISQYTNDCFVKLQAMRPGDMSWSKVLSLWQKEAVPIYEVWWEVFNLDEIGDVPLQKSTQSPR